MQGFHHLGCSWDGALIMEASVLLQDLDTNMNYCDLSEDMFELASDHEAHADEPRTMNADSSSCSAVFCVPRRAPSKQPPEQHGQPQSDDQGRRQEQGQLQEDPQGHPLDRGGREHESEGAGPAGPGRGPEVRKSPRRRSPTSPGARTRRVLAAHCPRTRARSDGMRWTCVAQGQPA